MRSLMSCFLSHQTTVLPKGRRLKLKMFRKGKGEFVKYM
jgi:hypothetical protein